MQDYKDICHKVVKLTDEVASFIAEERTNFDSSKIEYKGLNDLVSYVDKTAEKKIVDGLMKILPDAGFIGEEGTNRSSKNGLKWIIDPLDGTTNFIHGIPIFSISIALISTTDYCLGVVREVNLNECFYAWKDGGAYLNGISISVSSQQNLKSGLIATGFPYYDFEKMPQYMNILMGMMEGCHGIRRLGSAAVDLAYVACGRLEGFFEYNLNAWDVAGGSIIVKEAGGTVTTFSNEDTFIEDREIIAAPPTIHKEMQSIIYKKWNS
ncbi:inositol monophosphatase family protein [Flammeovirga kamogawensis]|uniref:Inositol-1-monophosphatase n=1 Tax=Flammeovirga kamogawensis TaxID=373891 RepID=A0ABX8GUQ1_9BACT|nr:inositol monophosphatase family protein [Flammeovirga kamogawensis]MBB6459800.1 myo-inositol-1(or 4)-monophosphatase [Flammeovirga kamogawensis]QWG07144.1 inositol monophosphatase [Flammeovirga kamogawensis]TRX68966.1 inositol monophosphatase [Flammeovirga kamogawensis]